MPIDYEKLEDNLKLDPAGELLTAIQEKNIALVREILKYDPNLMVEAPANNNFNIRLGSEVYIQAVKDCIMNETYITAGEILEAAEPLLTYNQLFLLAGGIVDQLKVDCKDPKSAAACLGQITYMMSNLKHDNPSLACFTQVSRAKDPRKQAKEIKPTLDWQNQKMKMLREKKLPWYKLEIGKAKVTSISEAWTKKQARRSGQPPSFRGH